MRILFITSTRLGDAVLSTGLLDVLLARYPQARFTIACGPVAAALFDAMPRRERTIVVTKRRYDLHWLSLWRDCVGTRWDLCVDLRGSAVTLFLPARRRAIMRGGRRQGARITHLGGVLGLSPPPLPVMWTAPADRAQARAILPDGIRWLALAPTANWAGKIWPADRFVALARMMQAQRGPLRPVILYGPGEAERAMASAVLAALPDAVDAGGHFTLPQVAALLARCQGFIGNDSGLMHLSAAVGTPTLGLFGPSRISEYGPVGRCARGVAAPGPEGEAPIAGLEVAAVVDAAIGLLDDAGAVPDGGLSVVA
ncbi:lipopolysaccharide heptosyltransferase [Gluconacetobacter johannae DSM 13595]|uniref:Glycosyltransferase family 9 protein n=1 Tax=Gluconacetobacter johannae TaxID=112140 RepID=A0A7W4P427_9PROT|nr:glycosyltransferase family 9 protein [Gluconacetobacter johannae]MBB2176474.1 glycosyltransferase family 9 protein [Gluconacetobacter johannae]GBQ90065.1 lipopolysaccharide heptosyltransferase [Gluconacetobacter johannae DSM 13595]